MPVMVADQRNIGLKIVHTGREFNSSKELSSIRIYLSSRIYLIRINLVRFSLKPNLRKRVIKERVKARIKVRMMEKSGSER